MLPDVTHFASIEEIDCRMFGASLEYMDDKDAARKACEDLRQHFDAVEGFQNLGSVDIVPRGCSKGTGVRFAKEALGARLMGGIGDSYNDIPLLQGADVSYTFDASPQQVRDAASRVVSSLAQALDDFMSRA